MIITKQAIEKIVGNKFFYISYFKKDGTYRQMDSARLNVSKHLKGGQNKNPNLNKTQIVVFDNNKSGYRTFTCYQRHEYYWRRRGLLDAKQRFS